MEKFQQNEHFVGLDASGFKQLITKIEATIARTPTKDAKLSAEARKKGDALFKKRKHNFIDHDQIFKLYCKSIALAPNDSKELALAYRNRSTFLFHIKRYRDCINDLDKVLNMVKLDVLKEKLIHQKTQCLLAMESSTMSLENISLLKEALPDYKTEEKIKNDSSCPETTDEIKNNNEDLPYCDENTNIFESVDIRYSNEHGRHLVAKRDFKPGDIIFIEKHYARVVDPRKSHISCSNCLSMCWSGIPCEKCNLAMFCSEACKDEAMGKFHDIECPFVTYMKEHTRIFFKTYHLVVRTAITALKEAGNMKKLRKEIESVDLCQDKSWRGFKNEETFYKSRFNSLYSLSSEKKETSEWITDQLFTELTVTHLAKLTTIFGLKQELSVQDLTKNPDILFFCSLLEKLFKIVRINSHSIKNFEKLFCAYGMFKEDSCMENCCSRGSSISPISSLINHSCYNNVSRCFSDDGKIIIYALQPIKQNSEIFDCYRRDFTEFSKQERQQVCNHFEFVCDCPACKHDWPQLLETENQVRFLCLPRKSAEWEIFMQCKYWFEAMDLKKPVDNLDEAVKVLSMSLMKAFDVLPQPCLTICELMKAMEYFFQKKYGYKTVEYGQCVID